MKKNDLFANKAYPETVHDLQVLLELAWSDMQVKGRCIRGSFLCTCHEILIHFK